MRLSKISSRIEGVKESAKQFELHLEGCKTYWIDKSKLITSPQKGQVITLSFYLDILCGIELDGKLIFQLTREHLLTEINLLGKQLEKEIYQEKASEMKSEIAKANAGLLPILQHRLAMFRISFPTVSLENWLRETRANELAQSLFLAEQEQKSSGFSLQDAAQFSDRSQNDETLRYALSLVHLIEQDMEMYKELGSFDSLAFASKMFYSKTLRSQNLFGQYCSVRQIVNYQAFLTKKQEAVAAV